MDALAFIENSVALVDFVVEEPIQLKCLVVAIHIDHDATPCCYEVMRKQASLELSLIKNCLITSKRETSWLMEDSSLLVC